MEKYNGTIQYIAILVAFLLPMVLVAKLFYILKTKQYSLTNLLTSAAYLVLITIAYIILNNAQRIYLAIYLGLVAVILIVLIIVRQLVKK
ncbi:hypothetical protein [Pedobacter gandavensis]|uniref:hypothetical protein n=1 Tax=Pedobacter gandavensis TaxID=2679963 RepID=UPI00292CC54C|nr:hypothetical protein [Pedobacter gandavensis]